MYNKWKLEGYHGWSDYDGKSDDNIHRELEVDTFFTEDDILAALRNHYKNDRSTAFGLTKTGEVHLQDICHRCKLCSQVHGGNMGFYYCYHNSFGEKGKWIIDIDKCPLEGEEHLLFSK